MTLTPGTAALRAHRAARGLTDRERIALGTAIIETVLNPAFAGDVNAAAAHLREHAAAIEAPFCTLTSGRSDTADKAITHEQTGPTPTVGEAAPAPQTRAPRSSPWRRVWDQFSSSARATGSPAMAGLLGDVLGGLSLFVLLGALLVLAMAVQP